MAPDDVELVSVARSHFGPSLQTVSTFDAGGYEKRYFRDDIDALYTDEELDRIFDELVLEGMTTPYLEQLFYAGDLVCSLWVLERAVLVLFVGDDHAGAFVTVDPDTDASVLAFIDRVKRLTARDRE